MFFFYSIIQKVILMNRYISFVSSVSKVKIKAVDEFLISDSISFCLSESGKKIIKFIQFFQSLRDFSKDIIKRIPHTYEGAQPEIGNNFFRIIELTNYIVSNLSLSDSNVQNSITQKLKENINIFKSIEQYIPHLSSNTASSMLQYLDSITPKMEKVVENDDKVIESLNELQQQIVENQEKVDESNPTLENQISFIIAAFISSLNDLLIQLICITSISNIKGNDIFKELNEWILKIPKIVNKVTKLTNIHYRVVCLKIIKMSNELLDLSKLLDRVNEFIPESYDFPNATMALSYSMQLLNEIEMKTATIDIAEVKNCFAQTYLNGESLDHLLEVCAEILNTASKKINNYDKQIIVSFRVFQYFLKNCQENRYDNIKSIVCLIGILRLSIFLLPDVLYSEQLLVDLSNQIEILIKPVFEESKKMILEISSFIDNNLEFFDLIPLNEVNFYLTSALKIEFIDPGSSEFLLTQQGYFDAICGLPVAIIKLIKTCSSRDIKMQLIAFNESLQKIGNIFARWLNQFYLCLFTIVHLRADSINGVIDFPLSLLCPNKDHIPVALKNVFSYISSIQEIMKSTPEIVVGNIADINSLIKSIFELSKNVNDFIQFINQKFKLSKFLLYKHSANVLEKIIVDFPQYVITLPGLISFEDIYTFTCALIASLSRSLLLMQDAKSILEKHDISSFVLLSPSFTFNFTVEAIIQSQESAVPSILPYVDKLKNSEKNLSNIIIQIALDQNSQTLENLMTEINSMVQSINEILICLKPPSLAYDIPEDIHEIRKYDSMIDSMYSSSLKKIGFSILQLMKKKSDTKIALNLWFTASQSIPIEIQTAISNFIASITNLMNSALLDRYDFIEKFADLSVSLANFEGVFGVKAAPIENLLHKELITLVSNFLQSENDLRSHLLKIYGIVSEIKSLLMMSTINDSEFNDLHLKILRELVTSLHLYRDKNNNLTNQDTFDLIERLKMLSAFMIIQTVNPEDENIDNILSSKNDYDSEKLSMLLSEKYLENDELTKYIKIFSDQLSSLLPNLYQSINTIRDKNRLIDLIFEKEETFIKEMGVLIQLASDNELTPDKITNHMNLMIQSFSDAAIITKHGLSLSGNSLTLLSSSFVHSFSKIEKSLKYFFDAIIEHIKSNKNKTPRLKQIYESVVNEFDVLFNIVVDPVNQLKKLESKNLNQQKDLIFENNKNQIFLHLSTIIAQIARLNNISTISLVPEMYNNSQADISSNIKKALIPLQTSITNAKKTAVGESSVKISELMAKLDVKVNELITGSSQIVFESSPLYKQKAKSAKKDEKTNLHEEKVIFIPKQIFPLCFSVCKITSRMAKVGASLTDKIVVKPDPDAAAQVQTQYTFPPLPSKSLYADEAFNLLQESKKQLDIALQNFRNALSNDTSPSKEILDGIRDVTKSTDDYITKGLETVVATLDPRYQVNQLALFHDLANSLEDLLKATKERLLRSTDFETCMKDALSKYTVSLSSSYDRADFGSKKELTIDFDDDMLTKELHTTSLAVSNMSAKLKEFEQQINMSNVNLSSIENDEQYNNDAIIIQIDDLESAIESFPGFLIASSEKVLGFCSIILARAKEITINLKKQGKVIENEKGLVKSAQDLSDAAQLLLICAEILIKKSDDDPEFKAIAASRIIRHNVATLVSQVGQKGGDQEGIMKNAVSNVRRYANAVIARAKAIANKKIDIEESLRSSKPIFAFKMKLEQNDLISKLENEWKIAESNLKDFRKKISKKI